MPLRALVSDNAKVWIRRALSKLGVEVAAYSGSFAEHRAQLIQAGNVSTVWDVGAHVGQFGARLLSTGYRGGIVSIEPSAYAFTQLRRRASRHPLWTVVESAISNVTGPVTLNLSANGQSSSLLPMMELHVAAFPTSGYVDSQVVPCTTLDLLRAKVSARPPFYIKLDVQGGELPALQGATEVLSAATACEVELSLARLYQGQSSWQEVVAFLASAGFTICDIERVVSNVASGDLLQINAMLRRIG